METIFKVGDRVYDFNFGWGTVVNTERTSLYIVEVKFDNCIDNVSYTIDGKFVYRDSLPRLSFTKYDFVNGGFGQERPINYEDYIGKWGKFWVNKEKTVAIGKLCDYKPHTICRFKMRTHDDEVAFYTNFEPLTEEQIKALGLCD